MILKVCEMCHAAYVVTNVGESDIGRCNCGKKYFECDEEIYPLLEALWGKNYKTKFSCSGHPFLHDFTTGEVQNKMDYATYISICASSVKVPDLIKYKYGYAHIEKRDPREYYANEMRSAGVNISSDYIVTPEECTDGTIFDKFVKEYYPEEKEDLFKWLGGNVEVAYDIKCTSEFYDKVDIPKPGYISNYMDLLELRHDIAKLIQLLPYNEII